MMIITNDSHLDHALSAGMLAHILGAFADRDAFFIETIELPAELGTVPCGLHGPAMGDEPVMPGECHHAKRPGREYVSRLCERDVRQTRLLTVVAGPHDGHACILYTAYGGPIAPQEPGDPSCRDKAASMSWWSDHALSRTP